jgi:hypothetical protein
MLFQSCLNPITLVEGMMISQIETGVERKEILTAVETEIPLPLRGDAIRSSVQEKDQERVLLITLNSKVRVKEPSP